MPLISHYRNDSCTPEWLREASVIEDEANAEELYPAWRREELARKYTDDAAYGDYSDEVAEATGIRRTGEL